MSRDFKIAGAFVALAFLTLGACHRDDPKEPDHAPNNVAKVQAPPVDKTFTVQDYGAGMEVLTDVLTNCQYIVAEGMGTGLTPRMYRDPETGAYRQLGCTA